MTLAETIRAAIADVSEHGYDSEERIRKWTAAIHEAAEAEAMLDEDIEALMERTLRQAYEKTVEGGSAFKVHQGVDRFGLERVKPRLRAELDRRLAANRELIKLNRTEAMARTQRRFAGWATSVPAGGTDDVDYHKLRKEIRKPIAQLPFESRRVAIDQGAKLIASVSEVIATDNNAIAGMWRSHWKELNYSYRPEHKARDKLVYAVRGSWAIEDGFINKGAGYLDEMDQVAQLPFCRCFMVWRFSLKDLPPEMLTKKGQDAMAASAARRAAG